MGDIYKPFDAVATPANFDEVQTPTTPGKGRGLVGGFTDWYDKLEENKKNALSTGLMTAGLSMMEAGGKSYATPVSGLSVIGQGGLAGVNSYQNTLEQERRDVARNKGLSLSEKHLGLAESRESREAKEFAAKEPYLESDARLASKAKGLQLDLVESQAAKNNAIAEMKGFAEGTAADKVKFQRSKETINLISGQLKADFGINFADASPEEISKALSANPSKLESIKAELSKPGNEKLKAAWNNAWNNIYGSMGVESNTVDDKQSKGVAGNADVDMEDYINSLLNYDYTKEEE